MIQKLKKRRPSENNQRPAELSVRIPNSTYASFHLDSATSRSTGAISAGPLAALPDLSVNQGDFRGSIIIDTLSKRFSVLRAKASPIRSTFPNHTPTEHYPSHASGIEEIRQRLAAQRQRAQGTGRYVAEDEENLVLEELALPEDHYARIVSPLDVEFPPSPLQEEESQLPKERGGPRTYGFGATAGMKEAEVMMRAHTGKRSVSDRSVASGTARSRSGTPLLDHREDEFLRAPVGASGKRKSLLAMLPVEKQERITKALLEIEEDMQAEAMEAEMMAEPQPSETLAHEDAEKDRSTRASQKSASQPITPQHKRQASSISRSPFRENLAQIAKGIDVDESGSATHSGTHSRTHSRATSSISIAQPDFTVKQASAVHSAGSSRQSSRRGHSRAGSSADLNRFRFGSGLAERLEDVPNVFALPPLAPAPTAALPPIPTPPQSYYEITEEVREDADAGHKQFHHRTPSASASPIPAASLETGYVPGSARPFTSPRADSPLERVGNHDFGAAGPPVIGSRSAIAAATPAAPPLVRKGSKLISPNRPGPLMLQPMLMPRSMTAGSLPSVSPVVETFAHSAERKGDTLPGPYSDVEASRGEVGGLDIPQRASTRAVDAGVPGASPLDASFDIDGYYGAGRSPVEAITRYPSQPQTALQPDNLLRPPSSPRQQPVPSLKTRSSRETLQSTFTENSADLPSPALYNFPSLGVKRVESGSSTPLSDVFGSDIAGEGDDGKQELFDELQAMQERLLEAAREVRRGLNVGTSAGDTKRKETATCLVSPSTHAGLGLN
ncbi:hypothetical protein NCC49_001014 [Naganishia albida]|nr:hypothetical protein NCC49_001014 [Naganishia albida]